MTAKPAIYNPARRIESLKPYFFHTLNQKIASFAGKRDGNNPFGYGFPGYAAGAFYY